MNAHRRFVRIVVLGVLLAFIVGVMPAYAATTAIDLPDADYLARTTRIDFSAVPEASVLEHISDSQLMVSFGPMLKFTTPNPSEPYTWGYPPFVESTLNVPYVTRYGPVDMTLSEPVTTFGLEIYNGRTGGADITVTFLDDASATIATVEKYVEWDGTSWDARLFAVTSDTPIVGVHIQTSNNLSVGYGQFRYELVAEPETVSTPASSPWSLVLLAGLAVGAAFVIRRRYAQSVA